MGQIRVLKLDERDLAAIVFKKNINHGTNKPPVYVYRRHIPANNVVEKAKTIDGLEEQFNPKLYRLEKIKSNFNWFTEAAVKKIMAHLKQHKEDAIITLTVSYEQKDSTRILRESKIIINTTGKTLAEIGLHEDTINKYTNPDFKSDVEKLKPIWTT